MFKMRLLKTVCMALLLVVASACVVHSPLRHLPRLQIHLPDVYQPWGYYYYPGIDVYYHYSSGMYYYPSGSRWISNRTLPRHFHLSSNGRVHLTIKHNKPWKHKHKKVRHKKPRKDMRRSPDGDKHERREHRKWHKEQKNQRKKANKNGKRRDQSGKDEKHRNKKGRVKKDNYGRYR